MSEDGGHSDEDESDEEDGDSVLVSSMFPCQVR